MARSVGAFEDASADGVAFAPSWASASTPLACAA
jgi:hypothetical protein